MLLLNDLAEQIFEFAKSGKETKNILYSIKQTDEGAVLFVEDEILMKEIYINNKQEFPVKSKEVVINFIVDAIRKIHGYVGMEHNYTVDDEGNRICTNPEVIDKIYKREDLSIFLPR